MEELGNPSGGDVAVSIPGVPMSAQSGLRALYTLDKVLSAGGVAAMLPGDMTVN